MADWWHEWDADDVALTLVSAAPGMTSLSTMVCVKPRPDEAEALADPNGDPPDTLHVTLAYLGDYEGELEQIADALRIVAATHAPLEGAVAGYGVFAGADGQWPAILLPDVRGLVELRVDATEALVRAGMDYPRTHGFAAHITLKYVEGAPIQDGPFRPDQAGAPLHFDELLIVRGDDEILALPLTGAMPLTAAGGDLVAAGEPFCLPAELRGKTDPIRQAFVKAVMTPALEQAGLSWDITNPLAADVISRAGAHVVGISQTTQDDLMNAINTAHQEGLSIPDTAKAIRAHMAEASNVRATMIARTELAAAVNGGSLAATKIAAGAGVAVATKTWMTAPGAVYPRHEDYEGLDGQTVGLHEFFDVGGEQLQYPGDPDGDPGEVINCRCGAPWVPTSARAVAASRRRYRGPLVRLTTATGRETSVTPNHPILTRRGWIAAGQIQEGDDLVCRSGFGISSGCPDVDDVPTEAEKRFASLELSSTRSERVAARSVNFHGDIPVGEVDVVWADDVLADRDDSAIGEHLRELALALAHHEVSVHGDAAAFAGIEEPDAVRVTDSTPRDVSVTEDALDSSAADSESSRQRQFALAGGVCGADIGGDGSVSVAERLLVSLAASTTDTAPSKVLPDGHRSESALVRNLLVTHADLVELDPVIDIRISDYAGHVYNFTTRTGTYLMDGILSANCTLEYSQKESDLAGDNIDAAGAPRFSIEHHNRILRKAYARVDELEPNLAAVLQPILERAGEIAAIRFEQLATNHLTAADTPGVPPDWTPPAAEELLPINCEANADALGVTSGHAEAGREPLPSPSGGPGPGRSVVSFAETSDYEGFNAALAENARPGFLTLHTPEELARDKVFISPDGASGFVVTPEHDLQNVFRNADGVPGAGRAAVRMGVQSEGALTLDAYDGFLPDLYQREGFRIVGRMKFVDEFAPEGWKFEEYGRPDIIFMAQNADPAIEIKTFTDWDEAKAYALAAAREPIAPEVLDTADAMVARAAELEPATTEALSAIAKDAGGQMDGLDFAVKSQPSLVRKITGDLADARVLDPTATLEDVAGAVNDTLRYTMTFSEADYSGGVERTLARLEKDGYKQIKLKNYWGNADYQGINGVFEKDGYRFELQFHTPKSFELKSTLHAPYEKYRLATATYDERMAAWKTMSDAQSKIGVPPNVMSIGEKVVHPPPSGALPLQSPDKLIVNTTSTLDPGGKDIDAALSSISQQIQLPDDLAQIEAKIVGDPVIGGVRVEGYFTPISMGGQPKEIVVRRLSDRYAVFTHEFGHALDNALAPEGQMFATQDVAGNGLVDWLDAVQNSETCKDIAGALEQSATVIREAGGVPTAKDLIYVNGEPYYRSTLEYVLNPQELWARSFVQWRAAVDPKLAEHVAERLAEMRPDAGFWYWPDLEFREIADAVHQVLFVKDSLTGN